MDFGQIGYHGNKCRALYMKVLSFERNASVLYMSSVHMCSLLEHGHGLLDHANMTSNGLLDHGHDFLDHAWPSRHWYDPFHPANM